jgi:hypothetical protein
MGGRRSVVRAAVLGALLGATVLPGAAQEIVQAVLLDLTTVEVQVIVAGTHGDERVRCLVRTTPQEARAVAEREVASGVTSGRTTMVSLPLPLLARGEREFSVLLVRGEAVLARTAWRPLR